MILQYLDDEERLSAEPFVVKIDKTGPSTGNSILRRIRAAGNSKVFGDEFDNKELEMS